MSHDNCVPRNLCPVTLVSRDNCVPGHLCNRTIVSRDIFVPRQLCPMTSCVSGHLSLRTLTTKQPSPFRPGEDSIATHPQTPSISGDPIPTHPFPKGAGGVKEVSQTPPWSQHYPGTPHTTPPWGGGGGLAAVVGVLEGKRHGGTSATLGGESAWRGAMTRPM